MCSRHNKTNNETSLERADFTLKEKKSTAFTYFSTVSLLTYNIYNLRNKVTANKRIKMIFKTKLY